MFRRNALLHSPYTRIGAICLLALWFVLLVFNSVHVLAAESVVQPDAPGSISGIVTDSQGKPISGVTVDLYPPGYDYSSRSVSTDSVGWYKFMILGPGEYRIGFRDWPYARYLPEFYSDTQSLGSAKNVLVIGNSIENINAVLTKSSMVTGTISISGLAVSQFGDISVMAYKWIEAPLPYWQTSLGTQPILSTGVYTISGLSPGTYHICASGSMHNYEEYLVDCYGNVSHIEGAKDVVLGDEATIGGVDILLNDGSDYATIAGRVTNQAAKPISGTQVSVYQVGLPGGIIGYNYSAFTDINGNYRVNNLISEAITYAVYFSSNSAQYVGEYYENSLDVNHAHWITPKSREIITNINATLKAAAQITGVVTLQGEAPSQEGYLYTVRKVDNEWQGSGGATIIGNGQYTLNGLAAGTYHVCAAFWLGDESLGNCFGGSVPISATDIIIGVGETRTTVNFDVHTKDYEGEIAGKVTSNGVPTEGIRVDLEINSYTLSECDKSIQLLPIPSTANSPEQAENIYTFTDNQGNYRFQGLHDGSYRIRFTDPQNYFATEYYQESSVPYESTSVNLRCGAQLQHIDRILTQAGAITGTVRLASTRPISSAMVMLFRNDTGFWQPIPPIFSTDQNGNYSASGLLPGVYRVYFYPNERLYPFPYMAGEYYGTSEVYKLGDAADVAVRSGETTAKINVILGPDGVLWLPIVSKE